MQGDIADMDLVSHRQSQPGSERRQFRRFPMALDVQAHRDDLGDGEASKDRPEAALSLKVRNFSLGGMRGVSVMPFRRDERVTVKMPPFGTRPRIAVTGRVVRCDRADDGWDVGIEFCQTHEEPESCPWLRIPDLFYMAGETDRNLH